MITLRKHNERGHLNFGWLDTYHTFSFGSYFDRQHMGFRSLRVINQDRIEAGQGFGTHPHDNMEIFTYVTKGALAHKDSMGSEEVIHEGDVQVMSAGSGITHSEYNHLKDSATELYQIWLLPNKKDVTPQYQQHHFERDEKLNTLKLILSSEKQGNAMVIHQDANIYASILEETRSLSYNIEPKRHVWIQVVSGTITVNGTEAVKGDGIAISEESELLITAKSESEFLLFDLD
jgi:redox-sensitive bicupin YhaK (pirin superfamily)